jgi:hypothetical protein
LARGAYRPLGGDEPPSCSPLARLSWAGYIEEDPARSNIAIMVDAAALIQRHSV